MTQADELTVFYDARCRICRTSRQWIQEQELSQPIQWVDSSEPRNLDPWPRIPHEDARGQMMALTPDGRLLKGYDAVVYLLGRMPAYRVLQPFLGRPPLRDIGRNVYRWVARNRYRLSGTSPCDADTCRLDHA